MTFKAKESTTAKAGTQMWHAGKEKKDRKTKPYCYCLSVYIYIYLQITPPGQTKKKTRLTVKYRHHTMCVLAFICAQESKRERNVSKIRAVEFSGVHGLCLSPLQSISRVMKVEKLLTSLCCRATASLFSPCTKSPLFQLPLTSAEDDEKLLNSSLLLINYPG